MNQQAQFRHDLILHQRQRVFDAKEDIRTAEAAVGGARLELRRAEAILAALEQAAEGADGR